MSQNDTNHESVEEAVFKYVGVGLEKSGEDDAVNKQKSVDWFLKEQDQDQDQDQDPDRDQDQDQDDNAKHRDANDVSAVAAAAVAAALSVKKRGRPSEQSSSGSSGKGSGSSGQNNKKSKKNKNKLHLAAVDPELASLDDNLVDGNDSEEQSHHQLVHKAIMDTDNIASQHPDFQQYLNTEDDQEPKKEKSEERSYGDLSNIDDHVDDVSVSGSIPSQVRLKKTAEVLPKVLSSESHNDDQQDDVSNLIQEAAAKASHIINPATQSNGKSFDESEEEALEQFIKEYQKIRGLSRRQICERIWSNERRKDDFWTNICRVLPYRTRSSIYKHVRRKYHIFEQRGKWTPEEDAELARWCAEKEGQWSNIGKVLGRMPEDCRDRWRNYVKCGPNRAANKWSVEEEEKLKNVIHQMLDNASTAYEDGEDDEMKDSSTKIEDSGDADMLDVQDSDKKPSISNSKKKAAAKDIINWTVVSEQMGGSRSRIQCRYKWNKLLKKEALNKIKNISDDDKFWLLTKLRDMGFTEDSQVDWEELSTLMPGRRWTGTELKLLYEKVRTTVRQYKRKTINVICKELVGYPEASLPLDDEIRQHHSGDDEDKD
ncbi:Nsi1/Reb1 [Kluyveromyces lactis]|nr:Nsi1/Reb1 [Kluyveromyces lactis]